MLHSQNNRWNLFIDQWLGQNIFIALFKIAMIIVILWRVINHITVQKNKLQGEQCYMKQRILVTMKSFLYKWHAIQSIPHQLQYQSYLFSDIQPDSIMMFLVIWISIGIQSINKYVIITIVYICNNLNVSIILNVALEWNITTRVSFLSNLPSFNLMIFHLYITILKKCIEIKANEII